MGVTFRLYHHTLSPFCRKLRLVLSEKKVEFELVEEKYWEKRQDFLLVSPAGKVPVLRGKGRTFTESQAICEYIDATYPDPPLIPEDTLDQYEARRLVCWFDGQFHEEVTSRLVGERALRKLQGRGLPDATNLAKGRKRLHVHLGAIHSLLDQRRWIAGDRMTIADFAAAAHISCLDFVRDIEWSEQPLLKDWYAIMKSRPAFQPLLNEYHSQLPRPPDWYSDLDF